MTRQLPVLDTTPWYRQFWPWFLILLPASVVVASLYTAYVANQGADDLVVEDYYKNGLAINRRLEKQQRAHALGLSIRFRFAGDTVSVAMAGSVTDDELRLRLTHPMEADRDFTVILTRVGPELYRGTLTHDIAAHWHWTLEQNRENGWRLDGTVQAEEMGDARGD